MSIYKKTDTSAIRVDNITSLTCIKLRDFAGNGGSSNKTITVLDTSQYHELLLTCGPAVEYQTGRILASTIIPISLWLSHIEDQTGGVFQSIYSNSDYMSGVSRISNTSIKLYASPKAIATVYIR